MLERDGNLSITRRRCDASSDDERNEDVCICALEQLEHAAVRRRAKVVDSIQPRCDVDATFVERARKNLGDRSVGRVVETDLAATRVCVARSGVPCVDLCVAARTFAALRTCRTLISLETLRARSSS